MNQFLTRSDIADIAEKVYQGQRLDYEDGIRLYETRNLLALGMLADYVNCQRNGNRVYFVQNLHINPTNICSAHCNFCSYRRDGHEDDAYCMTIPDVLAYAEQRVTDRTSEFHIVGGLNPDLKLEYYCELLHALKQRFPSIFIKAFTAVEIDFLARLNGIPWEEVLGALKAAGLDAMPGGGAEIFHPRVRRKICPEKIVAAGWLNIHGTAHKMGLKTNATMLYGHIETADERVDHLVRLREQQDLTHGFVTFVPLAYHPHNNALGKLRSLEYTTGFEDLRNLAVSRLMLDNFPHIKAYWIMLTPKLAQISLSFGMSDIDGTVVEEKVYHDAGARTEKGIERDELLHLIRTAGKIPVERDALYQEVEVYA